MAHRYVGSCRCRSTPLVKLRRERCAALQFGVGPIFQCHHLLNNNLGNRTTRQLIAALPPSSSLKFSTFVLRPRKYSSQHFTLLVLYALEIRFSSCKPANTVVASQFCCGSHPHFSCPPRKVHYLTIVLRGAFPWDSVGVSSWTCLATVARFRVKPNLGTLAQNAAGAGRMRNLISA